MEVLDNKLLTLLDLLGKYSNNLLNKAPEIQKWSPSQIMNHLILSEKLSIAYCKKKLSFNPKLKKAGVMSILRTAMIRAYLHSPLKIKAPEYISTPNLPSQDSLENLKQNWELVRRDLKAFILELPEELIDKEIYKHPFGGRISTMGMLKVMDAHFENHQKQIFRAIGYKKS
jgi:hypothetical protein